MAGEAAHSVRSTDLAHWCPTAHFTFERGKSDRHQCCLSDSVVMQIKRPFPPLFEEWIFFRYRINLIDLLIKKQCSIRFQNVAESTSFILSILSECLPLFYFYFFLNVRVLCLSVCLNASLSSSIAYIFLPLALFYIYPPPLSLSLSLSLSKCIYVSFTPPLRNIPQCYGRMDIKIWGKQFPTERSKIYRHFCHILFYFFYFCAMAEIFPSFPQLFQISFQGEQ